MKTFINKSWIFLMANILLLSLTACGLLTVERIVDQRTEITPADPLEPPLPTFQQKLEQQDDLIEAMATQLAYLSTQNAQYGTQISYLATRAPALRTAAPNLSPTTPPLIVGDVLIEEGNCCIGAIAGESIEMHVRFTAFGTEASVTEMRYSTGHYGSLDADFNAAPWLPFVEQKSFLYPVPINWTGFYVRVQYRDLLGNLSPIYTDDISVEGMPAPTPSPGG